MIPSDKWKQSQLTNVGKQQRKDSTYPEIERQETQRIELVTWTHPAEQQSRKIEYVY